MSKKTRTKPLSERNATKEPDRPSATLKKHFLYNPILHVSLIILLGLLAYSNTFHAPFTFDDIDNIVENNRVKDISHIHSFFTDIEGQAIMARPLTAATFAINYYFGKLDTTGYHIFNLALHIANGILLYFLIKITAGYLNYSDDKKIGLIALFSSLIFIAHPIQTESVIYIVTRSALLSTFFFLLGVILFTKTVHTEGKRKLIYTLALFIISLMGMASREEFFIFPIILILYDLYFISRQDIKEVLKNFKIHLPVILTLAYVIYIVMSHDYGEHAGYGVKTITPFEYLMTQFNVHWTYLRLLFFPINQNLDYDYPIAKALFELPTILSFIGYIGLWITSIYLYRKRPVISFCILWFMVTLAPSSSFMPIKDVIFEHRLYMPNMGIIIAFTSSVFYVLQFRIHRSHIFSSHFSLPTSYFLLLSTVVILFSIATYQRNIVWKDEVSLWEDVVRESPGKARPHNNLGNAYLKGRIDEAINEYKTALRLNPDYAEAYSNLGSAYFIQSRIDEAINAYRAVLTLNPNIPEAHNNLGNAYATQGRIEEAINEYQTAIRINTDDVKAYYNLGNAYLAKGRIDEAINEYRTALKLNPDYANAHINLGIAYIRQGRIDDAINEYRVALKLNPDDVIALQKFDLLLKILETLSGRMR
ncbi:MAG: tetratricopeptide repeat protein [Nitrospirae bacterium]|nr:tetratricopeptide repeat protein [Nitrospirota bacterium]